MNLSGSDRYLSVELKIITAGKKIYCIDISSVSSTVWATAICTEVYIANKKIWQIGKNER